MQWTDPSDLKEFIILAINPEFEWNTSGLIFKGWDEYFKTCPTAV